MPNWSDGEGGGPVHNSLARLLGSGHDPQHMLFFASAGNTALRHWTGLFHANASGLHEWAPGRTINILRPWGPERVAVEMYGRTNLSCELQVFEESTGNLVGKTALQTNSATSWGQAVVRFDPRPGQDYFVRVQCSSSMSEPCTDKFHLVILGGNLRILPRQVASLSIDDRTSWPLARWIRRKNGWTIAPVGLTPTGRTGFRGHGSISKQLSAPSLCRHVRGRTPGCSAGRPVLVTIPPRHARANSVHAATLAVDLYSPGHDCETGYGLLRLP